MVFKYTEALALDLRVFAKHGKRAVVGVDDIKCVARKDPRMASQSRAVRARARIKLSFPVEVLFSNEDMREFRI